MNDLTVLSPAETALIKRLPLRRHSDAYLREFHARRAAKRLKLAKAINAKTSSPPPPFRVLHNRRY